MLDKHFEALGFSKNEQRVFLDLAEMGRSTAQMISKRIKIPRATTYWSLDQLRAKGLVFLEQRQGATFFSLHESDTLLRMVQREKDAALQQFASREQAARDLARAIKPAKRATRLASPKVQIYEGNENVEALLYDYQDVWQESVCTHDHYWWGYQDHTFAENYLDWLKLSWTKQRPDENYNVLTNLAPVERHMAAIAPRRRMKFVPEKFAFSSSIWVAGEYMVLIMTRRSPHYALQLRNLEFANSIRGIFQLLWETIPFSDL